MNSAERTTVGSSPIPSAEAICQLCGPFFGLRQLSREDISAVYPLLMLGRGLEPSREARAVVHEQMRPALPPRAERYARSKRHLRANRPPVAQRPPPSALEALAECALEQATTQFLPGARLTAESSDCDDEYGESLLSSPPTEHTPAIIFDGAVARNECRPDSASSLPSPPLSPQLGSRKRAVPPTRHLANAKKSRECISCGTRQTPCWRPSWDSRQGQLCNSCGLRFRKSRARCVSPDCRRIPARSELAEARTRAGAHHPVCCRDCGCALLFYSK